MFALPYFDVSGFLETCKVKPNRQKVKLAKMALNHLQEPRDIKIRQCKHKVGHFIRIIFYT